MAKPGWGAFQNTSVLMLFADNLNLYLQITEGFNRPFAHMHSPTYITIFFAAVIADADLAETGICDCPWLL